MTHEYLIDVTMIAALRVRASSEDEAKEKLHEVIDGAHAILGWLDGEAVACEPSVDAMTVVEIDGEAT